MIASTGDRATFAAAALTGLLASNAWQLGSRSISDWHEITASLAKASFDIADAMVSAQYKALTDMQMEALDEALNESSKNEG